MKNRNIPFICLLVTYSGTKVPQTELPKIQEELYQDSATWRNRYIDIDEKHKAGADVYESKVTLTAKAATDGPVTADGTINLQAQKTPVNLDSFEFSDFVAHKTLLNTRFEKSMQAGAYNLISSEFDNYVMQQVQPAIGEVVENMIWNGAKTATKAAIAALTPGAGQGSISAGAQTLVVGMPTNLVNSIPATILYNDSQSKTVPGAGLGDYRKVLSITQPTATTVADEYGKLYLAGDQKVVNSKQVDSIPMIFAPLGDRQLIMSANNTKGAAQQINFIVENAGKPTERITYNGVQIEFVPLVGFRILCPPKYLKVLCDLASDLSHLDVGPVANGAMQRYIKNIQTMTTWVTNQRYITMYGG